MVVVLEVFCLGMTLSGDGSFSGYGSDDNNNDKIFVYGKLQIASMRFIRK